MVSILSTAGGFANAAVFPALKVFVSRGISTLRTLGIILAALRMSSFFIAGRQLLHRQRKCHLSQREPKAMLPGRLFRKVFSFTPFQ
jgi:hypothetical protein